MSEVQAALSKVQKALDEHTGSLEDQASLMASIKKLQIAAEGPKPYAATLRFEVIHQVCIFIALEEGILDAVVATARGQVTAAEIARRTGSNELLVVRVMRVLNNLGIGEELDHKTYASNAVAEHLTSPPEKASIEFGAQLLWPLAGDIAAYIRSNNFHPLPLDPGRMTPFTFKLGAPNWDLLRTDKEKRALYDDFMAARRNGLIQAWYDIYPAAEKLIPKRTAVTQDMASKKPLIVDIGGGKGQDLVRFIEANGPEFDEERFVLEDLPETLERAEGLPGGITKVVYDFFEHQQPIKGAPIYFIHNILHDFPDEKARVILSNTATAMDEDSVVLIHDFVLRDRLAQRRAGLMDWARFLQNAGMERPLGQWTDLLDSVGLKVLRVWPPKGDGESVVEASLKAHS